MFYIVLDYGAISTFSKDDTHLKRTDKSARGRVDDVPMNQDLERSH